MADDFDPTMTTEEVERWENQRNRTRFYPQEGSCCFVVYVNCSDHQAAIQAKLDAVQGQCDEFAQLTWHPTAQPDADPSVDLRVTVRTDDHAPE